MSISRSLRFAVLRRDHFTCRYCGRTPSDGTKLTVDHLIPVAHGGSDDPMNLITACLECNAGKAAAAPSDLEPLTDHLLDQLRQQRDNLYERIRLQRQVDAARAMFYGELGLSDLVTAFRTTFGHVRSVGIQESTAVLFLEKLGLPRCLENIDLARRRAGQSFDGARYFFGICWNQVRNGPSPPNPSPDLPSNPSPPKSTYEELSPGYI